MANVERSVLSPRSLGAQFSSYRSTRIGGIVIGTLIKLVQLFAGLFVWEALVRLFQIDPRLIPSALSVGEALWNLTASGLLLSAMWVTMLETGIGFVLGASLGIALAVVLSEFRPLKTILQPYIVALQAVPKVALAPLFLIWFGYGLESKIALVVIILFFPVLINTMAGLESTTAEQVELMKAYRANRWQMLARLKAYVALPYVFAAFEVSLVLALIAAVIAEFMGSGRIIGLGTLIKMYDAQYSTDYVFAVIVVLSILGVLLHSLVIAASRYFLSWHRPA